MVSVEAVFAENKLIVGVPKEIKADEYRVALVPVGVEALVRAGHSVIIEASAGRGTGIEDAAYSRAGAKVVESAEEVYASAEMIVKVKEPQPAEYDLLREGQVIFTFFHFAASETLTRAMIDRRCVCIAYETIEAPDGSLPILTPMSEIAGRMAVQEGAKFLELPMEGRGILLGGVPGVLPATVMIIGGGVAGSNAAKIAAGMGANVVVLDVNTERLRYLDDVMPGNVTTLASNSYNIREQLAVADLVIGTVLRHGGRTPLLVTREMLSLMKRRAVMVDVSVDQGGMVETTRPTTHSDPIFIEEDVVHYCVANMPGAVAGTSTYALTNETLSFVLRIANNGWKRALKESRMLLKGLSIAYGQVVFQPLADVFSLPAMPASEVLEREVF